MQVSIEHVSIHNEFIIYIYNTQSSECQTILSSNFSELRLQQSHSPVRSTYEVTLLIESFETLKSDHFVLFDYCQN